MLKIFENILNTLFVDEKTIFMIVHSVYDELPNFANKQEFESESGLFSDEKSLKI